MPYFHVTAPDPEKPLALIEAYRVRGSISRYRPMLNIHTGTVRMPSIGDWIVSFDGQQHIEAHESFTSNYVPA